MAIAYQQAPAENSADWSLYSEVALTLLALFRRHGPVDLKNADGMTALHQACASSSNWMVKQLLEHGASVYGELGSLCLLRATDPSLCFLAIKLRQFLRASMRF